MRPFTLATAGLLHCPCSTFAPGPTARQTTSPERLSTAIRLGARGEARACVPRFDRWTWRRSPDRPWPARRCWRLRGGRHPVARTCPVPRRCRPAPHPGIAHPETDPSFWPSLEALRIQTAQLALGGDVIQPIAFHIRRARGRGEQEITQPAVHSWSHILPEKRAVLRSKSQKHTALILANRVHHPRIVGSHVNTPPETTGRPNVSSPKGNAPDDIPAGFGVPIVRRMAFVGGNLRRRAARPLR